MNLIKKFLLGIWIIFIGSPFAYAAEKECGPIIRGQNLETSSNEAWERVLQALVTYGYRDDTALHLVTRLRNTPKYNPQDLVYLIEAIHGVIDPADFYLRFGQILAMPRGESVIRSLTSFFHSYKLQSSPPDSETISAVVEMILDLEDRGMIEEALRSFSSLTLDPSLKPQEMLAFVFQNVVGDRLISSGQIQTQGRTKDWFIVQWPSGQQRLLVLDDSLVVTNSLRMNERLWLSNIVRTSANPDWKDIWSLFRQGDQVRFSANQRDEVLGWVDRAGKSNFPYEVAAIAEVFVEHSGQVGTYWYLVLGGDRRVGITQPMMTSPDSHNRVFVYVSHSHPGEDWFSSVPSYPSDLDLFFLTAQRLRSFMFEKGIPLDSDIPGISSNGVLTQFVVSPVGATAVTIYLSERYPNVTSVHLVQPKTPHPGITEIVRQAILESAPHFAYRLTTPDTIEGVSILPQEEFVARYGRDVVDPVKFGADEDYEKLISPQDLREELVHSRQNVWNPAYR